MRIVQKSVEANLQVVLSTGEMFALVEITQNVKQWILLIPLRALSRIKEKFAYTLLQIM